VQIAKSSFPKSCLGKVCQPVECVSTENDSQWL
jgi:hypothetical protein